MKKEQQLYEGKAKIIYACEDPDRIIMHYKDDATAGNGAKKGSITDKGMMNNRITALLYRELEAHNIPTHFIESLNEREQLCEKVEIIPLEVIVRNLIAGSMAKRLGFSEGSPTEEPIFELCYKNDALGDPLINNQHALALKACTHEELQEIYRLAERINSILIPFFAARHLILVDFKLEFGRNIAGEIILADEISPDTCRLWDSESHKKLDKDRFRRDLGGVEDAYREVMQRLGA